MDKENLQQQNVQQNVQQQSVQQNVQQQEIQQEGSEKQSKKKRGLTVLVLLLLLLCITVGYSVLSTTLNITGTSTIGSASWDVHFQNVSVTSGSVTATSGPTIQTGSLSTTYTVTLPQPGDFFEFTVQVKNAGSIDAKLNNAPTISGVSSAQDVYVNYSVKYSDGTTPAANDALNAGDTKTYRVRVEFDRNVNPEQLPTSNQTLNLTCSIPYVQK